MKQKKKAGLTMVELLCALAVLLLVALGARRHRKKKAAAQ